jgi:hypothetical protein
MKTMWYLLSAAFIVFSVTWPASGLGVLPLLGVTGFIGGVPSGSAADPAVPGRATLTPSPEVVLILPTGEAGTPVPTSPFVFPTSPPAVSTPPARPCTTLFPLGNVEAIELGMTQIPQLEASFGQATALSGRPTRFKFEAQGCEMLVTVGALEALEVELRQYGTLGLLLDRYGTPAGVGVSEGNLALIMTGYAVLFYPEQGVIAIFSQHPDELARETVVDSLIFRAPFEVEAQVTRLNLSLVTWQPPLR